MNYSNITMLLATISPTLLNTATLCWDFGKIYVFWSMFHWITIELYKRFCTPSFDFTWENFTFKAVTQILATPMYLQTPHCRALYWCFSTSVTTVNHFTATFVTWSMGHATGIFKGVQRQG